MNAARFLGILALTALSTCTPTPSPPTSRQVITVTIDSTLRSYILHLPPTYDGHTKLPLVMLLHGATDSAAYAEEAYHWVETANARGWILLLPDALGEFHAWHGLKSSELSPEGTPQANNDLAFLENLLDDLPAHYLIDTHRLYLCGHSSGAIMTYRLLAERSTSITAGGIVAGLVGDAGDLPEPTAPVPLIIFHGEEDPTIPIAQGIDAVNFWTTHDHCNPTVNATHLTPSVTLQHHHGDTPRSDIDFYTLAHGNHMWPGGKIMPGKTQLPPQDLSATDLMADFFAAHSLSALPQ